MKKALQFTLFLLLIFQLIGCSKSKDYVEMIPSDADFVIQINPKTIVEKGGLDDIKQFNIGQFALENLSSTAPELKKLTDQFLANPSDAGLDVISPIYIFGKKDNGKVMATFIMNMKNKSDFEDQLKIIFKAVYQKEIEFEDKNGYTFIKQSQKPYIAWNKKQFYFIAGEYGINTQQINQYFEQLTTNEHSLIENNSFKDFLKKTQDVNIWYTGNFLNYFTHKTKKTNQQIDFSKSAWATFLSFNKDNISFTQKFHPDPETKIKLEKRPMWKSKINTDFYKYFPSRSYFNFSFAVYPHNTRYILDNENLLTEFLANYEIDPELLTNSFEGELLLSIYDFEIAKNFNVNDFFEKHNNFTKNQLIPQFVLAGRMKDKQFYDHLITSFGKKAKDENGFHSLKINAHFNLYFAYRYNILYVTNNQMQMNKFLLNRVDKFNFLQSEFSNRAKNAMFGYMNLNNEDYPLEVKNYLYNQLPIRTTAELETLLNQFSDIQYNVTDEYTKSGTLNFKKGEKNTLNRVLISLDQLYTTLTTYPSTTNESN